MGIEEQVMADKDIQIEVLKGVVEDYREQCSFMKKVATGLGIFALVCFLAVVGMGIYHYERFVKFLNDYDLQIETTITTNDSSNNEGSISVDRK